MLVEGFYQSFTELMQRPRHDPYLPVLFIEVFPSTSTNSAHLATLKDSVHVNVAAS